MSEQKDIALQFLKLVLDGQIDEAYEKYVDPRGRHHNVYTPAGFEALKKGMKQAEANSPSKEFSIKQVLSDGNVVAIYSHLTLKSGEPGMSVMHMFRIENDKITELWDLGQSIPKDSPNSDGPF